MSIPPPPLDDPTINNPLECPPLRWGLIGCGRVSHDFAQALKHLSTASVVACAARSEDDAKAFAEKHNIGRYYGNYDELLKDDDVDIVYVGNIHLFRRSIGEKCLLANKHALLEKPFTCTAEDARYLANLAKERNLFLMEVRPIPYFVGIYCYSPANMFVAPRACGLASFLPLNKPVG